MNESSHHITGIEHRPILDSHLGWTTEYVIRLDDGSVGHGSAPMGETRSTFESDGSVTPASIASDLAGLAAGRAWTQEALDAELGERVPTWGAASAYALSTAFADASGSWGISHEEPYLPRLLVNVFNGSLHAYTNPVRSNFHEILLVPPHGTPIGAQIDAARSLLHAAQVRLRGLAVAEVNGNRVQVPPGELDHGVLELAASLVETIDVAAGHALMIDVAAGTWVTESGYRSPVGERDLDTSDVVDFWSVAVDKWNVGYIEDPLAETDPDAWRTLRSALPESCLLVGDDLVSGSIERLDGAAGAIGAVMIKPDRCATVTDTLRLVERARDLGIEVMLSHRSIETDSLALVKLAAAVRAEYVKIGPFAGFEAVAKVNAILRHNDGTAA